MNKEDLGTFFKIRENHNISYRSGQHKTELDLLVVRRQQMWRVRDSKIIAGKHVATQHNPLVFVVPMQKRREAKFVGREETVEGRKTMKWSKCSGDTVGTQWRHSGDTVGTQWGHSGDTVWTQPFHTKRG